ncbi:hypothetical protein B7P43_G00370 [Cryptotermes secundus]|uniref:Uncharacterized protein n=1 Tax=Cryptotermes secundus TaxID=105785 RepID=A0A2J7PMA0_9NEOP|nr:hypothetical protein B7P43_G00370 [Cryptotermes secundus]
MSCQMGTVMDCKGTEAADALLTNSSSITKESLEVEQICKHTYETILMITDYDSVSFQRTYPSVFLQKLVWLNQWSASVNMILISNYNNSKLVY